MTVAAPFAFYELREARELPTRVVLEIRPLRLAKKFQSRHAVNKESRDRNRSDSEQLRNLRLASQTARFDTSQETPGSLILNRYSLIRRNTCSANKLALIQMKFRYYGCNQRGISGPS